MSTILRVAKAEFRRGLRSASFISQIILLLIWMGMNLLPIMTNEQILHISCWQDLLSHATTNEYYFADLVLLLGTVSFSWSFLEDRESNFLRQVLQRIPLRDYCLAKLLTVSILSFLAAVAAIWVFVLLLQLLPLTSADNLMGFTNEYLPFVAQGQSLLYLLARCILTGLSCSLAAVVALATSAWINNLFVAVLFPFIFYQFLGLVLALSNSQNILELYLFQRPLDDPLASLAMASAGLLIGIALAGLCFYNGVVKERDSI